MVTVDEVRTTALSLPATSEKLTWGIPTFRVDERIFVSISDDDTTIGFAYPREQRAALIAAEPMTYYWKPGHDERYNWVRAHLAALDYDELREIVVEAWRMIAPKKIVAAYDALVG